MIKSLKILKDPNKVLNMFRFEKRKFVQILDQSGLKNIRSKYTLIKYRIEQNNTLRDSTGSNGQNQKHIKLALIYIS